MTIRFDWGSIFSSIFEFFKVCFNMFIGLLQIPTTPYGLVKFISEHSYIIFGSETLSKIVLSIVPLIVSLVIAYLSKAFGVKKTGRFAFILTIVLYVVMLYLFLHFVTWIIIALIILFFTVEFIRTKAGDTYYE